MSELLQIVGFGMASWGLGFGFGHLLKSYRRFLDSV